MWGGFVQGRLMARHGLLVGSLLTAVPVFLIHLPLAFETNGWHGTTWRDAFITWGVLLLAAPFQRYLIGTLLVDTRGSTLAAGLMHASINAAGAMAIIPGGWQIVPALILLTLAVVGFRSWRGLSPPTGTRRPSPRRRRPLNAPFSGPRHDRDHPDPGRSGHPITYAFADGPSPPPPRRGRVRRVRRAGTARPRTRASLGGRPGDRWAARHRTGSTRPPSSTPPPTAGRTSRRAPRPVAAAPPPRMGGWRWGSPASRSSRRPR